MDLQFLSLIIFPLYLFLHQAALSDAATSSNSPALYRPEDDFAVNCGSSVNSNAPDGRQWIGDTASNYIIISQASNGKLISSRAVNDQPLFSVPVPNATARISRSQFTYTFQVTPGQKFIRLHFDPASSPGAFKRSKAFFTVKAGPYTLLSNFSAFLTADALGLKYFAKEFCVNVEDNQPLSITFPPSPAASSDHQDVYAFVNGIEVVSLPTGLYHTQEGDPGALVVGKTRRFFVHRSIAMELVRCLNVGGSTISSMEETEYDAKENSHKEFSISINNQMAESNANLLKWSGESGVAVYRNYMVTIEGDRMECKRDLLIALCPKENHKLEWSSEETDATLKGLEVFKLSNLTTIWPG